MHSYRCGWRIWGAFLAFISFGNGRANSNDWVGRFVSRSGAGESWGVGLGLVFHWVEWWVVGTTQPKFN